MEDSFVEVEDHFEGDKTGDDARALGKGLTEAILGSDEEDGEESCRSSTRRSDELRRVMVEQLEFDKDTNVLMCFEDCVEEREQDAGKEHEKPALLPAVTPLKKETLGDDNDCGENDDD